MADHDSMEISSDHGQAGVEDIDIDFDFTAGQPDEDYVLQDVLPHAEYGNESHFPPSPAVHHDDLMVDDDNASYQMDDVEGSQAGEDVDIEPEPMSLAVGENMSFEDNFPSVTSALTHSEDHDVGIFFDQSNASRPDATGIDFAQDSENIVHDRDATPPAGATNPEVESTFVEESFLERSEALVEHDGNEATTPKAAPKEHVGEEQEEHLSHGDPSESNRDLTLTSDHDLEHPHEGNTNSDQHTPEASIHNIAAAHDVKVFYRETEFALFSESDLDDPDSFFLTDHAILDRPLRAFFVAIREIIRADLAPDDELILGVASLDLHCEEASSFAGEVTLAQILDVHQKLLYNSGADSQSPLYLQLGTRPNLVSNLQNLMDDAAAGKTMSEVLSEVLDIEENDDSVDELDVVEDVNEKVGIDLEDVAKDEAGRSPAQTTNKNVATEEPLHYPHDEQHLVANEQHEGFNDAEAEEQHAEPEDEEHPETHITDTEEEHGEEEVHEENYEEAAREEHEEGHGQEEAHEVYHVDADREEHEEEHKEALKEEVEVSEFFDAEGPAPEVMGYDAGDDTHVSQPESSGGLEPAPDHGNSDLTSPLLDADIVAGEDTGEGDLIDYSDDEIDDKDLHPEQQAVGELGTDNEPQSNGIELNTLLENAEQVNDEALIPTTISLDDKYHHDMEEYGTFDETYDEYNEDDEQEATTGNLEAAHPASDPLLAAKDKVDSLVNGQQVNSQVDTTLVHERENGTETLDPDNPSRASLVAAEAESNQLDIMAQQLNGEDILTHKDEASFEDIKYDGGQAPLVPSTSSSLVAVDTADSSVTLETEEIQYDDGVDDWNPQQIDEAEREPVLGKSLDTEQKDEIDYEDDDDDDEIAIPSPIAPVAMNDLSNVNGKRTIADVESVVSTSPNDAKRRRS